LWFLRVSSELTHPEEKEITLSCENLKNSWEENIVYGRTSFEGEM